MNMVWMDLRQIVLLKLSYPVLLVDMFQLYSCLHSIDKLLVFWFWISSWGWLIFTMENRFGIRTLGKVKGRFFFLFDWSWSHATYPLGWLWIESHVWILMTHRSEWNSHLRIRKSRETILWLETSTSIGFKFLSWLVIEGSTWARDILVNEKRNIGRDITHVANWYSHENLCDWRLNGG